MSNISKIHTALRLVAGALLFNGIGLITGCQQFPSTSYVTRIRVEDTESNRIEATQCVKSVAQAFEFKYCNAYPDRLITFASHDGMLAAWPEKADHTLYTNDITNLESLALRLKQPVASDGVSQYLRQELSTNTLNLLSRYSGGPNMALLQSLRDDLSEIIILKGSLYDSKRFAGIKISAQATDLMKHKLTGGDQYRINRILLSDAYQNELRAMAKDSITIYYQKYAKNKTARYVEIENTLLRRVKDLFGSNCEVSSLKYEP